MEGSAEPVDLDAGEPELGRCFGADADPGELRAFYEAEGWLAVADVLPAATLAPMRGALDDIIAHGEGSEALPEGASVGTEGKTYSDRESAEAADDSVRSTAFCVRFDRPGGTFRRLAADPRLLRLVRVLLGERVKLFRDQMLLKPPGGQPKPLHQDQSYFLVEPSDGLVTAWVALDDSDEDNVSLADSLPKHTERSADTTHARGRAACSTCHAATRTASSPSSPTQSGRSTTRRSRRRAPRTREAAG